MIYRKPVPLRHPLRRRPDPDWLRERLREARLMLIFTPSLCGERDPLEVLEAALPHVDMIQVRPKAPDATTEGPAGTSVAPVGLSARGAAHAMTPARELHDWTCMILDLIAGVPGREVPVLVNDRVDVARALFERGCAGVHLGQDDTPPASARRVLGNVPLIGLSTHTQAQVLRAVEEPIDYVGFGPVHGTRTKGYTRGLGSEQTWIAAQSCDRPLFPIGGITTANAGELEEVGRAAVAAAILCARDPEQAARVLRAQLGSRVQGRNSIASP